MSPESNPMKRIMLAKLTLNIGAGESGPGLEASKKILETISEKKAVITRTHKRTTFGMAKKRPIGVKVTIRGDSAVALLKRLLQSLDNRLEESKFDTSGSFSFGIQEYINIPGIKYDPDVGILGMDVCVTLERPGYRIKRRMIRPGKVGKRHRITREEAMDWMVNEFGIRIMKPGEEREEY